MKRHRLDLERIADLKNLAWAAHRAGLGKRHRFEVQAFFHALDRNLSILRTGLLEGQRPLGKFFRFEIWDPKPRIIHAPCFEDRVIHHALMRYCEPILDRALIPTTFACRKGFGTLKAAKKALENSSRFPWFAKVDMARYFDSIDHHHLLVLLLRKFKGPGVAELFDRILGSYAVSPGKGLPIGALSSQIFANYYLDGLDRYLLETEKVGAVVRYMDDVVWWGPNRDAVAGCLERVRVWLREHRGLELKENVQVNRTHAGMVFLGFKIKPQGLFLSRRRKQRYVWALSRWETRFREGHLNAKRLQAAYASVHAITSHAASTAWRRKVLATRGSLEV